MFEPTITPTHCPTRAGVGIQITIRLALVLLCGIAGCAKTHHVRMQQQSGACMSAPAFCGYQPTQWHPWPESVSCGPIASPAKECDCPGTVINYPEGVLHDVPPPDFVPPARPRETPGALQFPDSTGPNVESPVDQQTRLKPPAPKCRRLPPPDQGGMGAVLESWDSVWLPVAGGSPSGR